jgi:PAS domain S-box-containing protein
LIGPAADVLAVISPHGSTLAVHTAVEQVLGHSCDALLYRSFLEFVHPDDRELAATVLHRPS